MLTCYVLVLHLLKPYCSTNELYREEVKRLHSIFRKNGYPDWFFNKAMHKFQERCNNSFSNKKDFLFTNGIPYFGKVSKLFAKRLCAFVKAKFCIGAEGKWPLAAQI